MESTLRQIADAVAQSRGEHSEEERKRIFDRARMFRDRGYIRSTNPASQGKTSTFTEADVVAVVVALTASLNGNSWGKIDALLSSLPKPNTLSPDRWALDNRLDNIKAGEPVFAYLEIVTGDWVYPRANIGGDEVCSLPWGADVEERIIWPITKWANPVLKLLAEAQG